MKTNMTYVILSEAKDLLLSTGSRSLAALRMTALVALTSLASSLNAQTVAITGGKVYPVSGPAIDNATVLIVNGRIAAVGQSVQVPANARRIDAAGKWVTPGLINASTTLGVAEITLSAGQVDASATGEKGVAASFRVWEGFNPAAAFLPAARNDGVTTVGVLPGRGLVQGQAAAVDLVDGSLSDMMLKGPIAMVGDISNVSGTAGARGEVIARWRELLRDARAYNTRRAQYEAGQSRDLFASRADLEALVPVVNGTLPLWLVADRASDIEAALTLAREFAPMKVGILSGAEAWMVADKLAAARVPVIVGAMNNIPGSFNTLGARQENAGLLRARSVNVVLIGNGAGDAGGFNVGNLRYDAGNAVAYGMSWDDALRAITLAPAEAMGVADRVGSLAVGKLANVVVWSGDPFEFTSVPEHVLVHGREFDRPTRDEELTNRYKTQPPKYGRPPSP
ncbi:MAG TPA: amidohydrolase family protein [Gemmatimonadaceae bacterium]|nr:amidohydrolase family protein [Gemmatimonadaceae bacterium]